MRSRKNAPVDGLALVGLFFLIIMLLNAIIEPGSSVDTAAAQGNPAAPQAPDWNAVAPPYDSYFVTQGPHGESYGQAAIDLTAGQGAEIKSPINGTVAAFYIDEYSNTTLIIETSAPPKP